MGLNWNEIKSRALLFSKTWADACNQDSQAKADLALGVAACQRDGNDVALLALKRIDGAHAALH
jgi:hypothetical protein